MIYYTSSHHTLHFSSSHLFPLSSTWHYIVYTLALPFTSFKSLSKMDDLRSSTICHFCKKNVDSNFFDIFTFFAHFAFYTFTCFLGTINRSKILLWPFNTPSMALHGILHIRRDFDSLRPILIKTWTLPTWH